MDAIGTVRGPDTTGVFVAPVRKTTGGIATAVAAVSVQVSIGGKTTRIVSNITVSGGYRVVGTLRQADSPLVCKGTVAALVGDSVEATVMPGANGSYTVTNIKNTKTTFSGVRVPGVDIQVAVAIAPDVFHADTGTSNVQGDLITVNFSGWTKIGACSMGGPVLGGDTTDDARAGVTFDTGTFVDGVRKNLKSDPGDLPFTWVVTEL
jgi:hypothetical protein